MVVQLFQVLRVCVISSKYGPSSDLLISTIGMIIVEGAQDIVITV